jgi:alpha-N-arabinofuranosidase
MTSDADSTLADLRRKNGRAAPWKVPYVGVGNESWGCGGNMRPEYYADEFRRYATFVKSYSGNRVQRYASGSNGEDYNWTDVLMAQVGRRMQGLSMHYYTLPTGDWNKKGSATQFDEQAWHATLARTLRMEELLQKHSAIMDKYDPQKRVGLIVDEWGTWYDVEPGTNPGFLYQQNSLRDAVAAAINLNLFHQHSDRVLMANIAQMVNVLQAMILTDKDKMVLTPTYHVFEMYKVHQDATSIPIEMASPPYRLGDATVPALHVSASRDKAGRLHVSIVNLDPNRAAQVSMTIAGASPTTVTGRVLTAATVNAVNTFDAPETVKPVPMTGLTLQRGQLTLNIPSKSVVVVEIQ